MKKQPAKINYFFKDAYIEFWKIIANAFVKCGNRIALAWESVCESFSDMWTGFVGVIGFDEFFESIWEAIKNAFFLGYYFGKLVLSAILTPTICILVSVIQIVAIILLMIFVYFGYILLFVSDWIYRQIKKISTSCPNCQEKHSLATYVCTCGAKHTHLVPSKYGILNRECECGRLLSTTFFNGREKMKGKWICPSCYLELGGPLQVDIPIPVVGGPSAGKTCYISMAITQIANSADKNGLVFSYKENTALGDDYKANSSQMQNGRLPDKTSDTRLRYYQFYLTPKGEKIRNLVSICDVAGETYSHNEELGRQIGLRHANAFLMLIDPLSIMSYRDEVAKKIDISKYGASEKGMDEILDALIHTLESMKCIDSKSSIKTDVAVVFTKCDIPGLKSKIGHEAVLNYMQAHQIKSLYDAQNKVCEQFLMQYGEDNFLNSLKAKFKSVQFFTCSALGHVQNGQTFIPDGVEEPALWLIDKASASINLKDKWGRKI